MSNKIDEINKKPLLFYYSLICSDDTFNTRDYKSWKGVIKSNSKYGGSTVTGNTSKVFKGVVKMAAMILAKQFDSNASDEDTVYNADAIVKDFIDNYNKIGFVTDVTINWNE